ncbi:MAG: hypothetical protein WCG31_03215 [Deltaproteobacteria bacterium]
MTGFCKAFITASIGLCISACATTEKAQLAMQSQFIGQPVEAFFSKYGMPMSSFPMSNSTIYRWRGGETSIYVPAEYRKLNPNSPVTGVSKSTSTTQVSNPNPNTTVTETTTTKFSVDLGDLLTPQGQVSPAHTVPIFCEAQITADTRGVITAIHATQDTRGFGLSLSRCAELFDVK